MNQETRSSLQSATQELRQLLETDFSEQLSGTFDIMPDGTIAKQPGQHLVDPKDRLIRRKVVEAIEHLISGGKTAQEAVQHYIREGAFTFLNRFVALRMMEARGLLQPCVSKGDQSSGFKEFCGLAPGLASLPDGGYRLYLECLFDELSVEIKVLFNRRDAASLLWPRRAALAKLLEILERQELSAAWSADETIGWVYQFFIELEKKDVFDRLYKKKQKIKARDIPAATQIFTPRWIVRFLVENTLGRLWADMHPESSLATSLKYLVPIEGKRTTTLKSVKQIRLLDPSCGTMHFGLVAFDLFVQMYREEIKNAGQPGWPTQPPVASEEEIPSAILSNNLHGIDIDLRAVQLSALTLYLKAKSFNPKVRLTETRLACADIHMLNGGHLGEFLAAAGLDKRPIYGRILKAMQQRLKDADQLGSLLRMEEEIRDLIAKERSTYLKEGLQPDLFGWSKEQFESEAGQREFWETLEVQIGQALDAFAREQAEKGRDQSFFSGETTKGLRLLELMNQRYDIVVTNPPYMTARNMNEVLKGYVQSEYTAAKGDLYAAFIQRCTEWLIDQGRLGMVTQQSFMFISSYEKLREHLRQQVAIENLPHVGPRAFEEVSGEKVNTTLLVFRKEPNEQARNESVGMYFRLVKQPDAESKRERFEQAVASLRSGHSDSIVYRYKQADFDAIPGSPWVYWITPGLRNIFKTFESLGSIAKPLQGLATTANVRFLRKWWENGLSRIAFGCDSEESASESGKRWFPYMKGGGYQKWYGNQEETVLWEKQGAEIREVVKAKYRDTSYAQGFSDEKWDKLIDVWVVKNRHHYFKAGVTYSYLTSGNFSARISPGGFVFDVAGSTLFPEDKSLYLAVLNSTVANFFLRLINPTVNFQVGDLARIPVPSKGSNQIEDLVKTAIDISKQFGAGSERSWDFISPHGWKEHQEIQSKYGQQLRVVEAKLDEQVFTLYGVEKEDRAAIEKELAEAIIIEADIDDETVSSDDVSDAEDDTTVYSRDEIARQWLSYAVGIVLGRFQPGIKNALGRGDFSPEISKQLRALADSDGVMVLDAGHPHDLAAKVIQALSLMLGDTDARECIIEATGKDGDLEEELRRYLGGNFFKEHLQKYRKRPVYWLLQSPRKTYGIYLFHERITKDTLYRIRSEQYVGSKLKLLNSRLSGLEREAEGASGRELKTLQKSIEEMEVARDDLQEFARKIDELIALGYQPHIDDGVLINMAPLWQLLPSWSAEPKKCWEKLVAGDYDWSHMAMNLWPERVIPKCVENASYAIALGLDEIFWTQDDRDRFQPKPKPEGGWKSIIEKLVAERTRPGVKEALTRLVEATSTKKVSKRGRARR